MVGSIKKRNTFCRRSWVYACLAAWAASIAGYWVYRHSFGEEKGRVIRIHLGSLWGDGAFWSALSPALVAVSLVALYALRVYQPGAGRGGRGWAMRPVHAVSLFVLSCYGSWNCAAFFYPTPAAPTGQAPLDLSSFWSANASLTAHVGGGLLWAFAAVAVFHSAGAVLLRKSPLGPGDRGEAFVLRVGVGAAAVTVLLFLAASARLLNAWVILAVALAAVAWAWRESAECLSRLWKAEWKVPGRDVVSCLLLVALLASAAVMNFLMVLRPCPMGWDDLENYMNRARLVGERGALVGGWFPYPAELVNSAAFACFGSAELAMVTAWLAGVLSAGAVFVCVRRAFSPFAALASAAVWYTMPMVMHLSSADLKVDSWCFLYACAAVLAASAWLRRPEETRWCGLCWMMAGMATAVKLMGALLVPAVAWITFVGLRKAAPPPSRWLKTAALGAALFAAPLAPWLLHNISRIGWRLPASAMELFAGGADLNPSLAASDWAAAGLTPPDPFLPIDDAVSYYKGWTKGVVRVLRLPWDTTMNTFVNDFYVIVGFLFLAVVPVLPALRPPRDLGHETRAFLVAGALYWSGWAVFGYSVVWYALPGFLGLAALVGLAIDRARDQRSHPAWFGRLLVSLAVCSVVSHCALQARRFGDPQTIAYQAGRCDADGFVDGLFPGYRSTAAALDADRRKPPFRLLRVGTMMPYFLRDNDGWVVHDSYLNVFRHIDGGGDSDSKTLDRLNALGIRRVLFDLNISKAGVGQEGSVRALTRRFVQFAQKNLSILEMNTQLKYLMLRVPPSASDSPSR